MDPEDKSLLSHHKQQDLCTTRLPYRQGRKLTAVKVYTVNDESVHLLVFGVPSLNLRQETKTLFLKFGKLLQFNLTKDYPNEKFTETYHALYEKVQSSRIAKRMLDGKNFYGGSLHVCYAPELENLEQLRKKLLQRKIDIGFKLKRIDKEAENNLVDNLNVIEPPIVENLEEIQNEVTTVEKLDMGEVNVIKNRNKRKKETNWEKMKEKLRKMNSRDVEVVDFTSVERDYISNINEALNYKKFGDEVVRKVPQKPLNRIVFNVSNKKDGK